MDSKKNARKFLDLIDPYLVIFIKYDYWYYYLDEIRKRKIDCLLISAVFRRNQPFFKWYGSLQRKMIRCFTQIFVQNEESKKLLETISVENCVVSGDTRFDSVIEIEEKFRPVPQVEGFITDKKCVVAGSTWKEDEEFLQKVFADLEDLKLIIIPHEIGGARLKDVERLFPNSVKFSELNEHRNEACQILIVDNVGMLSRIYKYAYITYVGGGFTKDGVHNVLEAAVYAKPVVFGKNFRKYQEAISLVEYGGAQSFPDTERLYQILSRLLNDEDEYERRCQASKKFVWENQGATQKILNYIAEKRLLTSW